MACPFCGCFTSPVRAHPGYEPDAEDFARANRAAELFKRAAEGAIDADERAEMRGLVDELYHSFAG